MSLGRKQRRAKEAKLRKEAKKGNNPQLQQALAAALQMHKAGNLAQAEALYIQILNQQPTNHEALHLLGVVKFQAGKPQESIALIGKAVEIFPNSSTYYNNLGNSLVGVGEHEKAIESYKKALAIKADYQEAINNIGAVLHDLGRLEEEIYYYKQGLANAPESRLLNEMVKAKRDACDWDELEEYKQQLIKVSKAALDGDTRVPLSPYHALTLDISPALKKDIAVQFSRQKAESVTHRFEHTKEQPEKIKIGYVSSDFRDHPTAHLIRGLFEQHNRDEFEVYAYSYGKDDQSEFRKNIEGSVDYFVDLWGATVPQIAQKVHQDGIHILVDIMGYIQNSIPELFAMRPAPVQINYLAYPGTMGAEFMDYLVTDHVAVPNKDEDNYTENLIFMPDTYFATDNKQEITSSHSRADFELPEDAFVFCSFNKTNKIDSQTFDCWMEILQEVPDSVLWLLTNNEFTQDNLCKEADKRGVDPSRFIFAGRLPKAEHLERYQYADVFLDCFAVNAHTTAIDCLWAGLPIVTLRGDNIISRASASILYAMGLPELVADSVDDYKELVLNYAKDASALKGLKEKLLANKEGQPLFDLERYTQNLEKGFKQAWQNYVEDKRGDVEI